MDTQAAFAILGLGFTCGSGLVAVTVYAVNTRGIATDAAHKARNVENVAARKDVIAVQFKAITDSLDEIKASLKDLRSGV